MTTTDATTENSARQSPHFTLAEPTPGAAWAELADGMPAQTLEKGWRDLVRRREHEEQQRSRREQITSDVVLAVLAVAGVIYWLLW